MPQSTGLLESLKRLTGTMLAIIQARLELLSNEWETERLRVRQMFVHGVVALFFFGLSILLLTMFIVVLFWDSYRLQVLAGMSALFFIAGLLVSNTLRRLSRERSKLFATSLAEISDDRDRLAPRHE